jgi:benzoylformate decarboxylase
MFVDLPEDFSYVLGLQESIVVAMADAYAQVTGRAAFVNLHSAAGLGHAMGNLYTAYRNRAPLIVTTGQQTRDLLPHDPFLFNESPVEFPKPYVKWSSSRRGRKTCRRRSRAPITWRCRRRADRWSFRCR